MLTVTKGAWRLRWSGGGLADVFHVSDGFKGAVDCVPVGAWDGARGVLLTEPNRATLRAVLGEWIRDSADDYLANVIRYR